MKKKVLSFLTISLILLAGLRVKAQDEVAVFINESVEDAETAMTAYGSPLLRSIGTNFNSGWLNTASVKRFGEFDIRLVGTASFAPESDKTFKPSDFGLDSKEESHIFTSETILPTIFGEMQNAEVTVQAQGPNDSQLQVVGTYTIPTLEVGGSPMLMPQVDIGLVKGTELMIRGLPPVKMPTYNELDRLTTSYFAVGFKHDIKQWIPGIRSMPFSWAIYGAWSGANLSYDGPFLEPQDIVENIDEIDEVNYAEGEEQYASQYSLQRMSFDTKGYTLGTMVSKKLHVITIFGGFEINSSTTSLLFEGAYPYVNFDDEFEHLIDEFNVEADQNNLGLIGGVRFKLLLMSISATAAYVPDGYSSLTVGLGLGRFK